MSGGVTLRVTRVGPINAIVEGIFFGTANSTSAMLTTPSNGAAYVAPANVVLNATASTSSGTISKVEFFQGTTKLGEDLTSPYSLTWSNAPAGTYSLTAKATNSAGGIATSDPVQILVAAGSAAASFVRSDTTTKGNWRGTYGGDGFSVVGDTTSYPAYPRWFRADILPGSGRPRPAMSERCSARSATAASRPRGMHPRRSTSA